MSVSETALPTSLSDSLREQLHEFHLTGRPLPSGDPLEGQPLRPVGLTDDDLGRGLPLCFSSTGPLHHVQPLATLLEEVLAQDGFELLRGQTLAIARAAAEWLMSEGVSDAALADVVRAAAGAIASDDDNEVAGEELEGEELSDGDGSDEESPQADQALSAEVQRLLSRLPHAPRVLGFNAAAALLLHLRLLEAARGAARTGFGHRVSYLLQQMEGLAGRGSQPESASELASELGASAGRFLDTSSLSRSLRRAPAHAPLDPQRRERVRAAAATLREYLDRHTAGRLVTLFAQQPESGLPVAQQQADEPLPAALSQAREDMEWFSGVLRAVRIAALEDESEYEPERHDHAVARFDWTQAQPGELLAAPLAIAVDGPEAIAANGLGPLSALLTSGMPVHVVALDQDGRRPGLDAGTPDLAYLAMAHRDAVVAAAPLVDPVTLAEHLQRLAGSLRPALTLISLPAADLEPAVALRCAHAAYSSRATPALCFDPAAGASWATRFSLTGNPSPEELNAGVSAGAAAALDPRYRDCFAVLPSDAEEELLPLADYLDRAPYGAAPAIPYIEVEGPNGPLRAALTRSLAVACRDRHNAWRTYQELAGIHNEYAESAVAETRRSVLSEFEEDRDRAAEAARAEGAQYAVYRLVAALAGGESVPALPELSALPATMPPPAESAPQPVPTDAPIDEKPDAAPAAPAGPYIDSALCTSCDECINRNPKMFRYNEDKQAYIADASAGSYSQLVKAAAACPANCIHPGPAPE